eukprot:4253234-Pleurochrysis_carterae.AAC.1
MMVRVLILTYCSPALFSRRMASSSRRGASSTARTRRDAAFASHGVGWRPRRSSKCLRAAVAAYACSSRQHPSTSCSHTSVIPNPVPGITVFESNQHGRPRHQRCRKAGWHTASAA